MGKSTNPEFSCPLSIAMEQMTNIKAYKTILFHPVNPSYTISIGQCPSPTVSRRSQVFAGGALQGQPSPGWPLRGEGVLGEKVGTEPWGKWENYGRNHGK